MCAARAELSGFDGFDGATALNRDPGVVFDHGAVLAGDGGWHLKRFSAQLEVLAFCHNGCPTATPLRRRIRHDTDARLQLRLDSGLAEVSVRVVWPQSGAFDACRSGCTSALSGCTPRLSRCTPALSGRSLAHRGSLSPFAVLSGGDPLSGRRRPPSRTRQTCQLSHCVRR
jgi:hypothetical protein